MRWQQLFADLAAQFEAEEAAVEAAELASRTRAEYGSVGLLDRLRAGVGSPVRLHCRGAGRIEGLLSEVGVDWLLLGGAGDRETLVVAGAVLSATGLGLATGAPSTSGAVAERLNFRWAVRALSRDRSAVRLVLDDGHALTGTVDRVGRDFLELAEHPLDQPRRTGAVRRVHAVPLAAVVLVQTVPQGLG